MQVREWIIEKCSPAILRRGRRVYREESQSEVFEDIFEPKLKQQQSTQSEPKKQKRTVEKVSVEVDATPAARSASVLKQTPIELTKSLDRGLLTKQTAIEDGVERSPLRRSKTSVSLTLMSPETNSPDVNVTSRDEILLQPDALAEDTLKNIQKRNFPKVLPDFPDKRLSLQPGTGKFAPAPPPRVSTLDRCQYVPTPVIPPISRIPKTLILAHKDKPLIRKEPTIVIPPTIGPTSQKQSPHVNVQEPFFQKSSVKVHLQKPSDYVPDSKGPSEKAPPRAILDRATFEKVVASQPKKTSNEQQAKCLSRTNALDDVSAGSSSSSSVAKESTGTVKRGKKINKT